MQTSFPSIVVVPVVIAGVSVIITSGVTLSSSKRKDLRLLRVTDVYPKIPVVTAMTTIENLTLSAHAATAMVLVSLTSQTHANSRLLLGLPIQA